MDGKELRNLKIINIHERPFFAPDKLNADWGEAKNSYMCGFCFEPVAEADLETHFRSHPAPPVGGITLFAGEKEALLEGLAQVLHLRMTRMPLGPGGEAIVTTPQWDEYNNLMRLRDRLEESDRILLPVD